MPTASIHQPDSHIRLKSERLEVWGRNPASGAEEILREIPIRDLDRLILAESVQISSPALAAVLRSGIPVSVLGWNGQFLGGFLPAANAHGLARLRQYQRTLDPDFARQMAGRIITAKVYNQRRVLQRLLASRPTVGQASPPAGEHRDRTGIPLAPLATVGQASPPAGEQASCLLPTPSRPPSPAAPPGPSPQSQTENQNSEIQNTLSWLDALFHPISQSKTIDELRGYEGASTARYFQAWSAFLPPEFPFERRSTRPPLNAVNACISFGATLLYNEAVALVHAHGLDPSLGLLHYTEDGRWSLALDLIEPFRPALVEALALDLFSHQMLDENHFEPRNGGVYLNDDGRKKFILQYERRMERQFMSECAGHRTSLRQQLEDQAVMLKAALERPDKFEPFLMN
ncbi:MAG: CRISPR-associated endonuclease Cas1 [Verrucomicrobiota bacterium]|jgi:CRISPR-associated protein Cas1